MTNQEHPITPPPEELLDKWEGKWHHYQGQYTYEMFMAEQAAQWGADQELEACCEVVNRWIGPWHPGIKLPDRLRVARRPKPPSLKEQALLAIDTAVADERLSADVASVVRRALEALPND
jgi:hypothetical protein